MIYIFNLNRCVTSGTQNLERVEFFARYLNIRQLGLEDQSSVNVLGIRINFAIINILSKGQSWYNSLGYYSDVYKEEIRYWHEIRSVTLDQVLPMILSKNYNNYEDTINDDYYDNVLKFYCESLGEDIYENNYNEAIEASLNFIKENTRDIDFNQNIGVVFSLIYLRIKSRENLTYEIALSYSILIQLMSLIIPYKRFMLIKFLV